MQEAQAHEGEDLHHNQNGQEVVLALLTIPQLNGLPHESDLNINLPNDQNGALEVGHQNLDAVPVPAELDQGLGAIQAEGNMQVDKNYLPESPPPPFSNSMAVDQEHLSISISISTWS